MLESLGWILLVGLSAGWFFKKLGLPSLMGMILTGILLGPSVLNGIDPSILEISSDLRKIALIIILARAGLNLDLDSLKKVGRPAILMCFVPACFEMAGMILLAPTFLGVTRLEAAILGAVVAAVSPAVIVPKMLDLMEKGKGSQHSIPQLILAGASVDDVFVIVVFTAFTSLASQQSVQLRSFLDVPISILTGIIAGWLLGKMLAFYFRSFHMRDTVKILIFLGLSFLLTSLETVLSGIIPFASLIAIMVTGMSLQRDYEVLAKRLSLKFNKLWVGAEIVLFVLVGATVDLKVLISAGLAAIVLLCLALVFRMAGVWTSLLGTSLTKKERMFCMIAYTPKATVQAAIGGVPLSMGLACGNTVLAVAVLSIVLTAPLGAFAIDRFQFLLEDER